MKTFILFLLTAALTFSCSETQKKVAKPTGEIELLDGWVRPTKAGITSAAYFTIQNGTNTADSLLSISSSISEDLQIHESYKMDDGLMGMRIQGLVPIPANSSVTFKQGGLHVMILQPERNLIEGDSASIILSFSSSKEMEVRLPVKNSN